MNKKTKSNDDYEWLAEKRFFFLLLINDSVFRLHWKCLNLEWCLFSRDTHSLRGSEYSRILRFFYQFSVVHFFLSFMFPKGCKKKTRENQHSLLFLHVAFSFQHIWIDERALVHHKCIPNAVYLIVICFEWNLEPLFSTLSIWTMEAHTLTGKNGKKMWNVQVLVKNCMPARPGGNF